MKAARLGRTLAIASAVCAFGFAQQPARHGGPRLFLVEAAANKVQPPGTSSATATGAFILDPEKRSVTYELTYHGLENGNPRSIALHNFGAGGNGERTHTLCGDGGPACPSLASATLSGSLEGSVKGAPAVDPKLLGEFATGRMYLEIVGGNGRPEIRGQLEPNNAMVPVTNFVATLAPAAKGTGTGTAVLSEVHFADGRVGVFYRVTVAGTSGAPQAVALTGVPTTAPPAARQPRFSVKNALPQARTLVSRSAATGGTLTGDYQVRRDSVEAPLATRLLSAGDREVAVSVRTSRFPEGELYGIFRQVH